MKEHLQRLNRLIGSDPGFFLVALHALIETYMKTSFSGYQDRFGKGFSDNVYLYKLYLMKEKGIPDLQVFDAIRREHILVSQILHDFIQIDGEELRAGIANFLRFCSITGIREKYQEILNELSTSLELWDVKESRVEEFSQLQDIKWQLFELKQQNRELLSQLGKYQEAQDRIITLEAQLKILDRRKNDLSYRQDALTENSKQKDEVKKELQQKIQDLEKMARIRDYLTKLKRLTNYSRTRSDYEHQILKLSDEQQEILERITLSTDYLIQGAAGTGKTLVLLKALQKAVIQRETQNSLWENEENRQESSILLLSYTKTLVKYNRYLAQLLDIHSGGQDRIDTADSFIFQILHQFFPEYEISFSILIELCSKLLQANPGATTISPQKLAAEIEDFIYGNKLDYQEYCNEGIPRRGMGFSLTKEEREQIWQVKTHLEEQMLNQKRLSRGFAHNLICREIETHGIPDNFNYGYVFVDESQDLKPVDLWILKNISKHHIILAGDIDQTIYGISQPYTKAEIDIKGKSRILYTNYRSTIPVIRLAEGFRFQVNKEKKEDQHHLSGFREGPVPELFIEDNEERMLGLMYSKLEILLTHLHYDPGNISILVPTRKLITRLEEYLKERNIQTIQYTNEDFEFGDTNAVRISTLHSAKGLDMPVVILFIPYWPFNSPTNFTPLAQTRLSNNLLYVAMSRAMDILDIFISTEISEDSPIKELINVYNSIFTKTRKLKA